MHLKQNTAPQADADIAGLRAPSRSSWMAACTGLLVAVGSLEGNSADLNLALEQKPASPGLTLSLSRPADTHAVVERASVLEINQWRPFLNVSAGSTNVLLQATPAASFFRVHEGVATPTFRFSSQTLCNVGGCITYFAVVPDRESFARFPPETWEFVLANTNGFGQRPAFRIGEPAASTYMVNVTGSSLEEVSGWVPTLIKRLQ